MKKFMALMFVFVMAFLALPGCASGFVRDSVVLNAPESSKVGDLQVVEGDKDVTPRNLSVERVLNADGSLNHIRIIADVDKDTMLCIFTPEDSPQEGRSRVLIPRGEHGVFQIPAKYIVDFDLTHGNFIRPRSRWNPLGKDSWGQLTRNPAPGHHGIACVVNHPGDGTKNDPSQGTCLCFIDGIPAGERREQHRAHAPGAPAEPGGKEHKLPGGPAPAAPSPSGPATTYSK